MGTRLVVARVGMVAAVVMGLAAVWPIQVEAQDRKQRVLGDRATFESAGYWIYNDMPKAWEEARTSGKPMVVVLRCVPCEECVKLDDELIDTDPMLKELLDQFVRVRMVSTNGLDLSIFQFDTDQSWTMFLLNADGTIYGRFGTRSHRTDWVGDVSVEGMAEALRGALELHKEYPVNRAALAGKRGAQPEYDRPEKLPSHVGKYTGKLDWNDKVVASCIHCHQIGDAQRLVALERDGRLTDEMLFPYPHPRVVGLVLDPTRRAVVKEVVAGGIADQAGLKPGDEIRSMNGQPLLSIADVQWVLHHVPTSGGAVPIEYTQGGVARKGELVLPDGWRQRDDISWRASTWELRRRALGGLYLVNTTDEERRALGVPEDSLCLKVQHVGQYAPHDAAHRAGVVAGDVLVSFDGETSAKRETDLIRSALERRSPGDRVSLAVLRDGRRLLMSFETVP